MARRVGLLGGTFDPPHLGHLVVAESARVSLRLDEVHFLVAGDPWMKSTTSLATTRVELAEAATVDDPHLVVDAREIHRDGDTITAATLEELGEVEPETRWWFLLGADAASRLPEWQRGRDALALATFVVVTRPGHALELPGGWRERLTHLEVPEVAISSTELRARYEAGRATRYLVPPLVDDRVRARGLYGARTARGAGADTGG